jgi:uncharacterized protein YktB (UPF0637 family)
MPQVRQRNKPSSGDDLPPTPRDLKISLKHAKESVRYNRRHMKDHAAALKASIKRLKQVKKMAPVVRARARAV